MPIYAKKKKHTCCGETAYLRAFCVQILHCFHAQISFQVMGARNRKATVEKNMDVSRQVKALDRGEGAMRCKHKKQRTHNTSLSQCVLSQRRMSWTSCHWFAKKINKAPPISVATGIVAQFWHGPGPFKRLSRSQQTAIPHEQSNGGNTRNTQPLARFLNHQIAADDRTTQQKQLRRLCGPRFLRCIASRHRLLTPAQRKTCQSRTETQISGLSRSPVLDVDPLDASITKRLCGPRLAPRYLAAGEAWFSVGVDSDLQSPRGMGGTGRGTVTRPPAVPARTHRCTTAGSGRRTGAAAGTGCSARSPQRTWPRRRPGRRGRRRQASPAPSG